MDHAGHEHEPQHQQQRIDDKKQHGRGFRRPKAHVHKLRAADILGRGPDARQAPDILAGHHELGQQHMKDERLGHAVGHGHGAEELSGLGQQEPMVAHRPGKKPWRGRSSKGTGEPVDFGAPGSGQDWPPAPLGPKDGLGGDSEAGPVAGPDEEPKLPVVSTPLPRSGEAGNS
jgi:hypothetical protein